MEDDKRKVKITIKEYKKFKQYELEEAMNAFPLSEEEIGELYSGHPVYLKSFDDEGKCELSEWGSIKNYGGGSVAVDTSTGDFDVLAEGKFTTKENGYDYYGHIELYKAKPE